MEPRIAGTTAGPVEIYYEALGDPADPAVLLVNGLGSQLINFLPGFCRRLVDAGFQVIRFDNRDVGLSAKTPGRPPSVPDIVRARSEGRPPEVPYTLSDMAADAVSVLDAVGVEQAHIWGMSMGGMIVQAMVLEHPRRVLTLTSVMSTTGNPDVGGSTPEALEAITTPVPTDREGAIESNVRSRKVYSGTFYDPDRVRAMAGAAYDRCFHPLGVGFQFAAIAAAADRTEALGSVSVPTTVIHGRLDTLVQPSGGEATAAAIPGAELVVYDEMGHDIPEELWDAYLCRLAARAR
jgi:pimeloyl-ACP methyl ester carboxylesterase